MIPNGVTVTKCRNLLSGLLEARLVRGVGRRAIVVALRPVMMTSLYGRHSGQIQNEDYVAIVAAQFALKRGWKQVVVEPDFQNRHYTICSRSSYFDWHHPLVLGIYRLCSVYKD